MNAIAMIGTTDAGISTAGARRSVQVRRSARSKRRGDRGCQRHWCRSYRRGGLRLPRPDGRRSATSRSTWPMPGPRRRTGWSLRRLRYRRRPGRSTGSSGDGLLGEPAPGARERRRPLLQASLRGRRRVYLPVVRSPHLAHAPQALYAGAHGGPSWIALPRRARGNMHLADSCAAPAAAVPGPKRHARRHAALAASGAGGTLQRRQLHGVRRLLGLAPFCSAAPWRYGEGGWRALVCFAVTLWAPRGPSSAYAARPELGRPGVRDQA